MIKKQFNRYGHSFTLVHQSQKLVIYERRNRKDEVVSYEIHKLFWRGPRTVKGVFLTDTNKLPTNEDFGKRAWSFYIFSRAIERFNELDR
jgi:hypothetical protein